MINDWSLIASYFKCNDIPDIPASRSPDPADMSNFHAECCKITVGRGCLNGQQRICMSGWWSEVSSALSCSRSCSSKAFSCSKLRSCSFVTVLRLTTLTLTRPERWHLQFWNPNLCLLFSYGNSLFSDSRCSRSRAASKHSLFSQRNSHISLHYSHLKELRRQGFGRTWSRHCAAATIQKNCVKLLAQFAQVRHGAETGFCEVWLLRDATPWWKLRASVC